MFIEQQIIMAFNKNTYIGYCLFTFIYKTVMTSNGAANQNVTTVRGISQWSQGKYYFVD